MLCTTLQATAQIHIGLRIAPQVTWSVSDNKNTKSNAARINAAYGLMLEHYFTDNYALATELSIQSYGTNLILDKSKFTSVTYNNVVYTYGSNLTYDYRLQYFQIPVLIKMRTKEIGYNRIYGEFGFAASFLTRAKADIQYGNFKIENSNINEPDAEDKIIINGTNNFSDKVSTFRGSMIIGAGIQRNFLGNSFFIAGLRHENGLSGYTADEKWKTRIHYIALNLGVLF